MATLGELKARIAEEIDRSDMTAKIASVVNRSIEFYADERFWFNEDIGTATTTADDEYVTPPTGLRREDSVFITVGGFKYPLEKRDRSYLQYWQSTQSIKGQPVEYAYESQQWRLFPTPNQAYTLTVLGLFDIAAPASDGESNAWTTHGEDLIAARARMLIARDMTYDGEMLASAVVAEKEAKDRLYDETSKRTARGVLEPSW